MDDNFGYKPLGFSHLKRVQRAKDLEYNARLMKSYGSKYNSNSSESKEFNEAASELEKKARILRKKK